MKRSALMSFLRGEAAGGILLMLAALAAMLVANSPASAAYFHALQMKLGPLSLLHWINDGLMALFFLLVGLEIKREFVEGHLARWRDRTLPMIAAVGGMAVPALIFLAVVGPASPLARGWAIPSATDIAFAIGLMALLGNRVPVSLKLFLTTVAIIDDMGAVLIIAFAYTQTLAVPALLAAALVAGIMFTLNRLGVRALAPYLLLAALLWLAVLLSGIHATVAGVLAACFIPLRARPGGVDADGSPLNRLEHRLQPWVAFAIVPLFGFANAGVSLAGFSPTHLLSPLPLAIGAGLFLGKQIGVFGTIWLCDRPGIAPRPAGASWPQIYGLSLLCGIGFTMSLFIGGLAYDSPALMNDVKIGVLCGSLLSAFAGYCVLRISCPPRTLAPTAGVAQDGKLSA